MKSIKNYWPWGLVLKNYIWVTWAQKTDPSAIPEPWLQFSQLRPHFLQNHEENPVKLWNLKKFIDLGAWGLGPIRHIQPYVQNPGSNIHKQHLTFSKKNHKINPIKFWNVKKLIDFGAWGPETTFGSLGPQEDVSSHKSRTIAVLFTNRTTFFQELWDESNKIMKSQKSSWPRGLESKN